MLVPSTRTSSGCRPSISALQHVEHDTTPSPDFCSRIYYPDCCNSRDTRGQLHEAYFPRLIADCRLQSVHASSVCRPPLTLWSARTWHYSKLPVLLKEAIVQTTVLSHSSCRHAWTASESIISKTDKRLLIRQCPSLCSIVVMKTKLETSKIKKKYRKETKREECVITPTFVIHVWIALIIIINKIGNMLLVKGYL